MGWQGYRLKHVGDNNGFITAEKIENDRDKEFATIRVFRDGDLVGVKVEASFEHSYLGYADELSTNKHREKVVKYNTGQAPDQEWRILRGLTYYLGFTTRTIDKDFDLVFKTALEVAREIYPESNDYDYGNGKMVYFRLFTFYNESNNLNNSLKIRRGINFHIGRGDGATVISIISGTGVLEEDYPKLRNEKKLLLGNDNFEQDFLDKFVKRVEENAKKGTAAKEGARN